MLIASRQKLQLQNKQYLSLIYNHKSIPPVETHTILGIVLDKNLQWSAHIDNVCKKIASSNYQLNCIKKFVDEHVRRIFYFAYIQPTIDYCLNIWGHCAESHIKRVFSQQKRAVKTVTFQKSLSNEAFKEVGIMPLEDRIKLKTCILMHKIAFQNAPNYLNAMFQSKTSSYASMASKFAIPIPEMDLYKSCFIYQGTTSWNNLPIQLRNQSDPLAFRRALERLLNPP